jgi:hypothetical protein
VKRSELVPFLTMFDAPEPTQSIGDRGNTTVPTQALARDELPFVRDMAARFSQPHQSCDPGGNDHRPRVSIAFCRLPAGSRNFRL